MDPISSRDLLYEVRIDLTQVIEFGVSLDSLMSRQSTPPPEGARFDVAFNGEVKGARVTGTIAGVDYCTAV